MKIFNAEQAREADTITIKKQQISSLVLMERAATQAYLWLKNSFPDKETLFHIFCGQGNNGGDGLVIARLLKEDKYNVVLDIAETAGRPTADFTANLKAVKEAGIESNNNEIVPYTKGKVVIVDAIFGIGLTREPDDAVKAIINRINNSGAIIVAIDVPSGLFLDKKTDVAVQADYVLTFQCGKLAFYLPDNYRFVNKVVILDIGLDAHYIEDTPSDYHLTERYAAVKLYKPLLPYAHKGTQGHALIIGGSYGKIGAVCLSAKAALKAGCGLVTTLLPKCGYTVIQGYFPEAMAITSGENFIEQISYDGNPDAVCIGPGIGQEPQTQQALFAFLQQQSKPVVIDADALNILSVNKEHLALLPAQSILTPHPKELQRLIGEWSDDFEMLQKIKDFSKKYNVIVVAKNAHTIVAYKDEVHINTTGNAALATGGSGDVLTGIITSLLAQRYTPLHAAILGVYLHGLTADVAIKEISAQAFTASDIIAYL
ncbi:NAD(P)H-hydrate dehydratase, partial [Flavobacterium sp.]|uniref:NAD(P)H-hydrate dehydratase n=1 Tax=Flavobacterium sp. TaxID=239 RepID=UPI002624F799